MYEIFIQGFFLQASLILALGAQNIFVLNSGLKKEFHFMVPLICSICDAVLIFFGVLGLATIFIKIPLLKILLGSLGVLFLFYYGLLKLKESRNNIEMNNAHVQSSNRKKIFFTAIGFSLLNPHVYLDTVVLIGGYSTKFEIFFDRFIFGVGASIFSSIWFFSLSILASFTSNFFNNKKSMRIVAFFSGLILLGLSVKLGLDVYHWI